MSVIAEEPSDTGSNDGSEHNPAEVLDSTDNIKLQRVTGVSMRHTKALPASVLKEGWMVHYTNKSDSGEEEGGGGGGVRNMGKRSFSIPRKLWPRESGRSDEYW